LTARSHGDDGPEAFVSFGEEEPPVVHSWVKRAAADLETTEAREHLRAALEWYEIARTLKPGFASASLGYGWCLEQAGRKSEAKTVYREIVDQAFAKPKRERENGTYPINKAVTGEALRYLIDL
jgi:3-methyladenine DNA glycosylase AlkD